MEPSDGETIRSLRDYYGTYHHHKEQMAFGAATLYLGGTFALVFSEAHPWENPGGGYWWVIASYLALVCSFAGGHAFVWWQLRNRAEAARRVEILTKCLEESLLPGYYWKRDGELHGTWYNFRPERRPAWATLLIMLVWSIAAALKLCVF
jgi:hypothetical protein